jgi:predicted RNA-binding protein Jag
MSNGEFTQALTEFKATGSDANALRNELMAKAQGQELYFQEIVDEDGTLTVYGYPRTQVMDLIYELSYLVVKLVDDRAMLKVKSNRSVTDFFVIIQSRKGGAYIGRHGQTLDAAEGLIAFLVSRKFPGKVSINVDVDNYRRKRATQLESLIKRVVRDIERDHHERRIPGLLAKERKFIHQYFTEHPYLTTESRGEGQNRTIFILPRVDIKES